MDASQLRQLLTQREGAWLDFKREMYDLYTGDGTRKKRQQDELARDVLGLVNGNASSVGRTAHLVIGAADELPADGSRALYTIAGKTPTATDILNIVNHRCAPPVEDVQCELVEVDGTRLLVVTIPPSPHLHETTTALNTKEDKHYSEYTAFTRHSESCRPASADERRAIAEAKQRYIRESLKPMPELLGALSSGVASGLYVTETAKHYGATQQEAILYGVIVGIFGTGLGGLIGVVSRLLKQQQAAMRHLPPKWQRVILGGNLATGVATGSIILKIMRDRKRRQT